LLFKKRNTKNLISFVLFLPRNLSRKDVFSKSDPFVVVFQQKKDDINWFEIGRTEVKNNTHNTTFDSKVLITYHFEEQQLLKISVYDSDTKKPNATLMKSQIIGSVESFLSTLVVKMRVSLFSPNFFFSSIYQN